MIRLTRPEVSGALDDLRSVLEQGLLVQGARVERFEGMVAAYVSRLHGVAVSSGTAAIHCGLLALGVGPGDEVVVPDFTFPATANAVVLCGARPVLVDIDARTFNIDPACVDEKITPKTKAVMPVDQFGLAADFEALAGICAARGVALVEDAACALGSSLHGRRCGSFGEVSFLSFHPRKVVATGEGGMVLTDRDQVRDRVRLLRNHGMKTSGGQVEFVEAGYNLRLTEIHAALGIRQMLAIQELIDGRRRVARLYDRLLGEVSEVSPPHGPEGALHTYQSYVVMVDEKIDRSRLIAEMSAREVETTLGTYAVHAQPFYRERFGYRPDSLPRSSHAFRHSLALPIYASMEAETAQEVVSALKASIRRLV